MTNYTDYGWRVPNKARIKPGLECANEKFDDRVCVEWLAWLTQTWSEGVVSNRLKNLPIFYHIETDPNSRECCPVRK